VTLVAVVLAAALALSGCGPKSVTVASTVPVTATAGQDLHADLSAIFNSPQFQRSYWSVLVRRVDSGDDLYALNAAKLMMPASVMKIVTLAAAADVLGWDHRFETTIVTSAPIEEGVLRGDLVVVGGGDPSISERSDAPGTLKDLARRVREAGVTRIEGGVIGHDDLFDDNGFGNGWTLDNIPYGYSAAVSALEYNEGSVDLVIRAGAVAGDPVVIQVRPDGSDLQIDNRLVTVAETGTGGLTLQRLPGSSRVVVQGQIPAKSAPFARTASVDNPTQFFAAAFRIALIAEGIEVIGDAADIDEFLTKPDLTAARTLVRHRSPALRELATAMMRVSQNQYAEMLLRSLGGAERVRDVLKGWSIEDGNYAIADGSGLSRYNYVTSDALVRILQRMHVDPQHTLAFGTTLPVTGREGTLSKRLAGTRAEGKVRAKTGTVDNVRAIAGYVETAGGETLVFSMIANNFTISTSAIDAAADKALVRLATYTGQP
jgi:serine-type D-Ala-D-Ala carboxypeptidase/endopeptidase (penicillin-binding protein 4)